MINYVNRDLIGQEDHNTHEENLQRDLIVGDIATCFNVNVFSSNWNFTCNKGHTSK